jgi:two-component system, OmpR family, KDP operon response regulator KdpE
MFTSHKVLIVDDEHDICFLLGRLFRKKNYVVAIANTLTDGLAQLIEIKPSILFLDVQLPDGSSLDALPNIRKEHPKVKIVIMSANDGAIEKKQAFDNGADLFISKPINKEVINQTLQIFKIREEIL